ncbi:MAG: hypothetical protein KAS23_00635 [Anaerohalosphaera sp.]|nr:hypothetical protein [Anaerohalosphaera sp.]
MNEQLESLFNESINLELSVAELYSLFGELFSEDVQFWNRLSFEERNHACLIQSGRDSFWPVSRFPVEMLGTSLDEVVKANEAVQAAFTRFRDESLSREDAFNVAYQVESSAGEVHYQMFMEKKVETKIEEVFQRLNNDDKCHADRILRYMEECGIELRQVAI